MDELTRRTALQRGLGAGVALALVPALGPDPAAGATPLRAGERAVVGRWVGAVMRRHATVTLRTVGTTAARLHVFSDAALTQQVARSASTPTNARGVVKLDVDGLSPGKQYYYSAGLDGVSSGRIGSFRTSPDGAASFSFAFGSCSLQPDSTTFRSIRSHDPDFFLHLGDLHYGDIARNDLAAYRRQYDAALAAPHQGAFLGNVPTTYVWSDHDFGGNGSDSTYASRPAAQSAYREYVPSYPLPSPTGGIYQTFRWGRVRFVATDNRSYKSSRKRLDDSDKTMLGAEQKRWFTETVRTAAEPVVVWLNENPWISPEVETSDRWGGYRTERDELARALKASGKKVAIVSGDLHALAADDGSHAAGGIPVFQAAPLDQTSSAKQSRYTHGPSPSTGGVPVQQYGVMQVHDRGSEIALEFAGHRVGAGAVLSYTHTFAV